MFSKPNCCTVSLSACDISTYIYNVDDDLDSGLERKKHDGVDKGMDKIELYVGLRNGHIVRSQADKDTVQ